MYVLLHAVEFVMLVEFRRHWLHDACGGAVSFEGPCVLDRKACQLLPSCHRQGEAGEVFPSPKAPRGGGCEWGLGGGGEDEGEMGGGGLGMYVLVRI